jgi:hypothetical protein
MHGGGGGGGAKKKGVAPAASGPPSILHPQPYDVGGGDLSDSSGLSDGGVDEAEDSTHHRIQALTGHYFVDMGGAVWLSHVSAVITQLVTVRPDPRMIMSSKVASRIAKTVRGQAHAGARKLQPHPQRTQASAPPSAHTRTPSPLPPAHPHAS